MRTLARSALALSFIGATAIGTTANAQAQGTRTAHLRLQGMRCSSNWGGGAGPRSCRIADYLNLLRCEVGFFI
jgi:hypothetical protein